jgi:hypothetical protein
MKTLIRVLRQAGKPAKAFKTADGTRVLVLPYGGRVLGLFTPRSGENFYWTHPALESVESARAFYAREAWHNSGGDRTWLAPEVDTFLSNFPKLDKHEHPRALDPGRYRVIESDSGFKLENRLTVRLSRLKTDVSLKITKSFGPAPNPLRHERGLNLRGVEYAGYTQYTSLEFTGASRATRARVGLWNLIQMPHGGDLLLPTFSRNEPRHIFSTVGSIPDADLIVRDHLVRYRMRQKGEHKISLRAVPMTGRAGYLHRSDNQWSLVIRNFAVNPSGEYVDVPWDQPDWLGFAVQACNVNSGFGQFSELEYHIPAIGHRTGRTRCDDASQVWAFRGTKAGIEAVARTLLTPTPWDDVR